MSISFECALCEAEFELELHDLIQDPTLLKCSNCGNKANPNIVENTFMALDEFIEQVGRLRRKFKVGVVLEPEEIDEELNDDFLEQEDDEDALWSDEVEEEEEDL